MKGISQFLRKEATSSSPESTRPDKSQLLNLDKNNVLAELYKQAIYTSTSNYALLIEGSAPAFIKDYRLVEKLTPRTRLLHYILTAFMNWGWLAIQIYFSLLTCVISCKPFSHSFC